MHIVFTMTSLSVDILIASYALLFPHMLHAQSNFHPALIMQRVAADYFTSEEVYISFLGCGSNNKSVIDQLPLIMSIVSDVLRRIENFTKENIKLAKELESSKLELSDVKRDFENLTKEHQRTRELLYKLFSPAVLFRS